ncbi:hypothetical protein Tco_0654059 [Tanacetum coccineum]|uniref:Uncharacterized protein n=1 Tax=Tanacetum coccineum TaxID=301880 RepID=A0ABQ4X2Z6_9ASTR
MSLANQKATTEYQEAIQATEDLESPTVGFAKTSDYKGGLSISTWGYHDNDTRTPPRSAGSKSSNVLRDTRWEDSRQIIATMEVDLSAGTQLVYTFPDMILSVNDFHNHVEVAIQTHGYDTWQGGESNLLITMALTGRLSNTSYMGFQYSVENVVDHLTTTVNHTILGALNERLNISVSLRFERYKQTPQPPRYSVDQHDREVIGNDSLDEDEEHFIGICSQAPQEEHISYDICFCEDCLNEARILEEEPLNKYDAPPGHNPKKVAALLGRKFLTQTMKLPQES